MKIRWSKFGLAAYKKAGDEMKALGFRALREIIALYRTVTSAIEQEHK